MNKNVIIFIPIGLDTSKSGCLKGTFVNEHDAHVYFITSDRVVKKCAKIIGFVGKSNVNALAKNTLYVDKNTDKITVYNSTNQSVVYIYYDLNKFKESDLILYPNGENYGPHFRTLANELQEETIQLKNGHKCHWNICLEYLVHIICIFLKFLNIVKPVLKHFATFSHFEECLEHNKLFFTSITIEKKLTPKTTNFLFSKITDLLLGVLFVKVLLMFDDTILNCIETSTQDIITGLRTLLTYLMGSPIGLKLNYAFNHSLGTFFFYHINLWRVFLKSMYPLLRHCFIYMVILGTFGLSHLIAMFSDLISIATFHVYCIYVYAARIFSLQFKGLISLWRLFIGRKYNPLRNRVDSCDYSVNQLFIGTLGFAILLFLLPTTMMYYFVFATFRLTILCTIVCLSNVKHLLNHLPVYVITMWIFRAPCVAGKLYVEWIGSDEKNIIKLRANLNMLSLSDSIRRFCPNFTKQEQPNCSAKKIFHNIVIGTII